MNAEPWAAVQIERNGRLGFSLTIPSCGFRLNPATLTMCVGRQGYVGLVPLAGQQARVHVGAALLPEACNARRGPLGVIGAILAECGGAGSEAREIAAAVGAAGAFVGTGVLTQRGKLPCCGRGMAIGDACGYVEPFTGEGMAWAIRGAVVAAVNLMPRRAAEVAEDIGGRWQRTFDAEIRPRQRWCRGLRHVVGNAGLTRFGMRAGAAYAVGSCSRIARQIVPPGKMAECRNSSVRPPRRNKQANRSTFPCKPC